MKVNFLLVGALALLMGCQGKSKTNEYVVIAGKSVVEDSLWNKVAQALVQKHEAAFLSYNQAPEEVLPQLQEIRPRYVAIVEKPEYLGRDYVIALNQMSRKVDNDMYGSEIYNPYTLSLTQKPAVSVAGVKAKKAVSKKAKKAVITWKKASGVDGYQVTYSLKKNFKKAKSVNVSAKKAKVTLKKLKRGKKYFVKVRAYRNVEGARYYGGYSKTLKVTVR